MTGRRPWETFERTYRSAEMQTLAQWILAGTSGSVVGLVGSGRSNLLGFLCHRPEVLQGYLPAQAGPVVPVPVDLNDLPDNDLATLYRIILRAFYQIRTRLDPKIQQAIVDLYRQCHHEQDPFVAQSVLHEMLALFQEQRLKVVLVLNRFDGFCAISTPQMINTLRSLRDSFKDILCFIVGMHQEVAYLPNPDDLGDMYDLLDSHVCWVGSMAVADAHHLITRAIQPVAALPAEPEITKMMSLAGNFPALLKAISQWWLTRPERLPLDDWERVLLAERSIQYRLARIWNGLTQEEQLALSEVQKLHVEAMQADPKSHKKLIEAFQRLAQQHPYPLERLIIKGLCSAADPGWRIVGDLLVTYIGQVEGRGRGKIWVDEHGQIHQGPLLLVELTDLQRAVLTFLIKHPYERHTKTDLIFQTWPDELRQQGVTDDALYQVIMEIRKQIEPNSSKPHYLVTWRGKPEGGYQFFPEGRPT